MLARISMARLPRLAIAQHAHLVLLRGHGGRGVLADEADRANFLDSLREACASERLALHGYALIDDRAWLLCNPAEPTALSRAMQSLGRRFAAGFNQRRGLRGAVWDGRFRATVVEAGPMLLQAMVFVDQACDRHGIRDGLRSALWSSARQHLGSDGPVPLTDAPEYWALGNTPFERAAAYGALLDEALPQSVVERIATSAERGWALGTAEFAARLSLLTGRPVAPRPRGRPRRGGAAER